MPPEIRPVTGRAGGSPSGRPSTPVQDPGNQGLFPFPTPIAPDVLPGRHREGDASPARSRHRRPPWRSASSERTIADRRTATGPECTTVACPPGLDRPPRAATRVRTRATCSHDIRPDARENQTGDNWTIRRLAPAGGRAIRRRPAGPFRARDDLPHVVARVPFGQRRGTASGLAIAASRPGAGRTPVWQLTRLPDMLVRGSVPSFIAAPHRTQPPLRRTKRDDLQVVVRAIVTPIFLVRDILRSVR